MSYFRSVVFVVDIGNSNVVIGVYNADALTHNWRIETHTDSDVNWHKNQLVTRLFEAGIDSASCHRVVLSSVVPDLTQTFESFLRSVFRRAEVITVGPSVYPMLELNVVRPRQIGSDLVANAYGAIKKYRSNCLVVDCGTALTVMAAGLDWHIHGISIAPGIKTAIQALHANTAQLPEVPLIMPQTVGGTSTEHAIQSGVLIGYTGLIKELVARYRSEWEPEAIVIGTGGLVDVLTHPGALLNHKDPNLTIDGLRLIGETVALSNR